jgi:hypothetical protein
MADSMVPAVICDIDGTLANCDHRLHFVNSSPKNWPAFFAAAKHDVLNHPVAEMINMLSNKYPILLVSGRPEDIRDLTEQWLSDYGIPYDQLYMRPSKDYRPDDMIKEEILDKIITEKEYKPMFVFDDRKSVCALWVRRGIFLFDVSQGKNREEIDPDVGN